MAKKTLPTDETKRESIRVGYRLAIELMREIDTSDDKDAFSLNYGDHNPDGSVPRVSVRMSPLGSVLSLAASLRATLSTRLPASLFL